MLKVVSIKPDITVIKFIVNVIIIIIFIIINFNVNIILIMIVKVNAFINYMLLIFKLISIPSASFLYVIIILLKY